MSSTETFKETLLWDADFCTHIRGIALTNGEEWATTINQGEEAFHIRKATGFILKDRTKDTTEEHEQVTEDLVTACLAVNVWNFRMYTDHNIIQGMDVIRYKPGDFYRQHTDWGSIHGTRKISFTMQLSDPSEYEGGEVVLYDGPQPQVTNKTQGTATFFPSWTLHEVKPITEGERWALVGWFCGPPYC